MKKKTILCGLALTAGLALVGCGNNDTPSNNTGHATGLTTGGKKDIARIKTVLREKELEK